MDVEGGNKGGQWVRWSGGEMAGCSWTWKVGKVNGYGGVGEVARAYNLSSAERARLDDRGVPQLEE